MKRFPYSTVMLAALALITHFIPSLTEALQFDRDAIAHGQWWRFLTAHLTHFGNDHLRWDLIAFVVLGTMAERISRSLFLITLGGAAVIITAGVWIAQPHFVTYRGLSGIDSALFGMVIAKLFAVGWRERHRLSVVVAVGAIAAFALKSAFEIVTADTLFVAPSASFAPVPLAHLLGLAAGVAAVWIHQLAMARSMRLLNCLVLIDCKEPSSLSTSSNEA